AASTADIRKAALRLQLSRQDAHQHAVVLGPATALQLRDGLFAGLRRRQHAVASQIDVGVRNRNNSPPQRNVISLEFPWEACAVEMFVVALYRLLNAVSPWHRCQHLA